jgi:H3 lysine-79-specific histone-lysine N-methyltransferase
MRWYGKRHGEYTIVKEDFLGPGMKDRITQSSIVFVNNFAFGPTVDHMLKEIFADLRDGENCCYCFATLESKIKCL